MNPFQFVIAAISLGGLIYAANGYHPALTGAIFLLGLGGAITVAIQDRRRRSATPAHGIDREKVSRLDVLDRRAAIKAELKGHDDVVDELTAALQEEINLSTAQRTLGAYLLVGPTGTGKTLLATLLARALYPETEPLVLRMNQLKHADDVFTLIGPPPGAPGHEVGGALTRPLLDNPYRVVVLDELEKCHHDLHDCLYDILDTARCREKSSGKMVDFSACAFFATCNAGVDTMRGLYEKFPDPMTRAVRSRDVLADTAGFERAFLARWTRIVLMDELKPIHIAEVALLQLCRYWRTYGIEVSYVAPELLLDTIERNEEFRQYGVRQLDTFIRLKTNRAISEARNAKTTRVQLDVSPDGDLVVHSR